LNRRDGGKLNDLSPDFGSIFNGLPGAFLVLSPELNLVAISDELQKSTSTHRDEIIGRYVFDVLPDDPNNPSGFKIWKASLEKVLSTRKADIMPIVKYRVRASTEESSFIEKFWRPGNFPVLNSAGDVEYIIHRTEEVTELQKTLQENLEAQQNAKEAEARMKFALAAAEMGDWELDLVTGEAHSSLRYDQCFGYSEAQPVWSLDLALKHVHPEDRQMVEAKHIDAISNNKDIELECRVFWVDGSVHWIKVRARTEKDVSGKAVRLRGIVWEITNEKTELEGFKRNEEQPIELARSRHFFDGETEMPGRFRRKEWSKTPLGAVSNWPQSLRTAVGIMLKSEFPMFIAWGEKRTILYNDAYAPVLGKKHPQALGQEFETVWSEIWPELRPLVEWVDRGKSVYLEDLRLVMRRNGFDEEVFFTFSYSPIRNESDKVQGLFCACMETTKRVHSEIAVKKSLEDTARSEREIVDTLESMSDAFFSLDKEWRITRVNKEHEKASKMNRDKQLGKNFIELWFNDPKYEDSHYLKAYRKAMTERVPVNFEDYYEPLRLWTEVRVYPKSDGGIAIFFTDVTERKTAQMDYEKNVDVSPAILWITDREGSCNYLSKQWYEFTGQTPEQALGFGWLEATHPEDKAHAAATFIDANKQQKPFLIEYRLKTKSGQYRWAVDAGNPRFDEAGNFLGYAGSVFDIHDQKIGAKEIEDINYRFMRSAQASDLGVWNCDLPFDVLNWNDEVKKHFFLPLDAHVTIELFYERIHPDDRERTRRAIQNSIDSKTPFDTVYRTTDPLNTNETKSIRAVGWTDYNSKGEPTRFDGITLNVTSDIKRRVELEAAKNEAERANQLKSSFLANMSHEIRTPLGAILGFTDLLKDDTIRNEERAQFLDTISRNGKALTKIIDDILDLAKVESGKMEIERIEFSFFDLIDDVMDLFRERTRAKGIYLRAVLSNAASERIVSDPTRLRQILINIVGNAVKFTHQGGVTIEVRESKDDLGRVNFDLFVRDTGVGMSPEQQSGIFEPFTQADNTTTRKFGGTGLGLALSKRLAKALGGDVVIQECTLKKGCIFVISFQASLPTINSQPIANESVKSDEHAFLFGIRILLADDSKDNLFLVSHILTKQGAAVDTADDGNEAFRMGMAKNYDIVLMDIQMPEMDGYEATRALRDAGFKKPIIALTAHAMAEERARSLAAGCNGHLTKPLNQKEMLETIKLNLKNKSPDLNFRKDH
jgi:PAS domain S-box-containing protein